MPQQCCWYAKKGGAPGWTLRLFVRHSPFFGAIIRYADFYYVGDGYELYVERMRQKVKEGYSIAIFPDVKFTAVNFVSNSKVTNNFENII